jgi:hypothetical protein
MHNTYTNERANVHYFYGFCSVSCRLLLRNTGEVSHIAGHAKPVHSILRQTDCFIPTSECRWWANNGVEMVTLWQQCSAVLAQAHTELSRRLRHTCREFCPTMVCISFKVYNTVYREVRPNMYEFAKCCKFCLTLCSRTLNKASQADVLTYACSNRPTFLSFGLRHWHHSQT